MKRSKIIIGLAVVLLLAAVFFMARDFFNQRTNFTENPYEYNIDRFKQVDTSLVHYTETQSITPEMEKPMGIAIDANDKITVVGNAQVIRYNSKLQPEVSLKTGTEVRCIAFDASGYLYLGTTSHVEVWSNDMKRVAEWKPYNANSVITSIAVSEQSVFVADAGNKVVLRYDKDGTLRGEIGKKNAEKGILGFVIPSPYFDLLLGRDGELWVVNPGRHSFEAYKENGDPVSTWKRTSMSLDGFSGCCNPTHIALLPDGSFVTSEKGIERVKIHSPAGDFVCVVAPPKSFDEGTQGLDLAVDSRGNIYVLDPKRRQVRVFVKK